MSGVLAIVGRPNVGKSALFNRIAGRRIAIVHDQPGVTRDRVTAEAEHHGRTFTLIDTGGIGLRRGEKSTDIIAQAALEQVGLAIDAASAIILVVNVQEGLVPLDQEVAARLREAGKPVLLAVNKSDNQRAASEAVDFSSLGFDRVFPVSAIHDRGIEALINAAVDYLPEPDADSASEPGDGRPDGTAATPDATQPETTEPTGTDPDPDSGAEPEATPRLPVRDFARDPLRLAIVGRPNVGKSSLINALTQSTRVVVSPIPGTTRDAVDVPFEVHTEGRREHYVLVDTAGVRKRHSIDNSIEFFSVRRTEEAITRCDIAVLILDAADGILEQDKKIGALITEARRACIVVVNKWDLVADKVLEEREAEIQRRETRKKVRDARKRMTTLSEFGQWVQEKLFFLDYAPVIFTSAQSGFHLDRLLEAVRYVGAQLRQSIPTGLLNRTLRDAVTRRQPVSDKGHLLKFFYATQIGQAPPKFLLFLNRSDVFNRAYEKFLAGELRKAFGYEGCPIVLIPRARPKTVESVRKNEAAAAGRRRPAPDSRGRPTAARRRPATPGPAVEAPPSRREGAPMRGTRATGRPGPRPPAKGSRGEPSRRGSRGGTRAGSRPASGGRGAPPPRRSKGRR